MLKWPSQISISAHSSGIQEHLEFIKVILGAVLPVYSVGQFWTAWGSCHFHPFLLHLRNRELCHMLEEDITTLAACQNRPLLQPCYCFSVSNVIGPVVTQYRQLLPKQYCGFCPCVSCCLMCYSHFQIFVTIIMKLGIYLQGLNLRTILNHYLLKQI